MGLTPVHAKEVAPAEVAAPVADPGPIAQHTGPAAPVPVVRRMQVGAADDGAERSADQLADVALARLARLVEDAPEQHRHGAGCDHVRRSASPIGGSAAPVIGFAGGALDGDSESAIKSSLRRGSPLQAPVRRDMEAAFGRSFDSVRVHDNPRAASLNTAISARAFTTGNDIFFGAGQYRPGEADGRRVLAHELAHVVQNGGAVQRDFFSNPFKKKNKVAPAPAGETPPAPASESAPAPAPRSPAPAAGKKVPAEAIKAVKEKQEKKPVAKSAKEQQKADEAAVKQAIKDNADDVAARQAKMAEPPPMALKQSKTSAQKEETKGRTAGDHLGKLQQTRVAGDARLLKEKNAQTIAGSKQRLEDEVGLTKAKRADDAVELAGASNWINDEQITTPGASKVVTSMAANAMHAEVEQMLTKEQEEIAKIAKASPKLTHDQVLALAYRKIWEAPGLDPNLHAVRPNRDTPAARLAWATRVQLSAEAAGGDTSKPLPLAPVGSMLPKKVERAFEEIETEFDKLRAAPRNAHQPDKALRNQAYRVVMREHPELIEQWPKEPAIKEQATVDARERLKLRATPRAAVKAGIETTLMNAIDPESTPVAIGEGVVSVTSMGTNIAGKVHDKALNAGKSGSGSIVEKAPGGFGDMVKKGRQAHEAVESGNADHKPPKLAVSEESLVTAGMGAAKDTLLDTLGGIASLRSFVGSLDSASKDKTPVNVKKTAADMVNALTSFTSAAKNSLTLANKISPESTKAVLAQIPGLDLGVTIGKLALKMMDVVEVGKSMKKVNDELQAAHLRMPGGVGLDVLVYPLVGIQSSFIKKLELTVWEAGQCVINFSTSLATVAGGGLFGIPAAIRASSEVLSKIHELAHFIADQVLISITLQAREDTLLAKSGAAENQMQKDPSAACNNMIMAARTGNENAKRFVLSFEGITEERLKTDKIVNLAAPMLESMGKDADPELALDKFTRSMSATASSVSNNWKATGKLKDERNELNYKGKADRGTFWRLKLMLQSDVHRARTVRKTQVMVAANAKMTARDKAKADAEEAAKPQVQEDFSVIAIVGGVKLLDPGTDQQLRVFASQLDMFSDKVLVQASTDPENPPVVQKMLVDLLQTRADKKSKAAAGVAPAPPVPVPA